jgi:hypothetical protein
LVGTYRNVMMDNSNKSANTTSDLLKLIDEIRNENNITNEIVKGQASATEQITNDTIMLFMKR